MRKKSKNKKASEVTREILYKNNSFFEISDLLLTPSEMQSYYAKEINNTKILVSQERLGSEFEKILNENMHRLYES